MTVRVVWGGPWDLEAGPTFVAGGVGGGVGGDGVVVVDEVATASLAARELMGDDPPTLAKVPSDMVAALADVGAIQPLGPCVASMDDPATDPLERAARDLGVHDEEQWGVPVGLETVVLLRDRALLARSGVDADRPPSTLADLRDQAAAARAATGVSQQVIGFNPVAAVWESELGSGPPAGAEAFVEMAGEGLLAPADTVDDPGPATDPLPVGSGDVAFAVVNPSQLWAYADAVAEGQAPHADLAVSALPGTGGPVVPVLGDVWVLSSSATDAEAATAGELVDWLAAVEQQAALVPLSDLLPWSAGAVGLPVIAPHWQRLPLLRQAADLLAADPSPAPGWLRRPGAPPTASHLLGEAASGEVSLDGSWTTLRAVVEQGVWDDPDRAEQLTSCLLDAEAGRASLVDCT